MTTGRRCLLPRSLAVLVSLAPAAALAAGVRLVPIDSFTFHVEVESEGPFLGGELGVVFSSGDLRFLAVGPGEAFPEGSDLPPGIERISAVAAGLEDCGAAAGPGVDAGVIISWIHPRDPQTGGIVPLPRGRHRVLELRFEAGPEAVEGRCHTLRFADCLGPAEAPVANVLTDENGQSVLLDTEEVTTCASDCRVIRFRPEHAADCDALVIDVREPDGTTSLARREVRAQGLTGFDLALSIFRAFEESGAGFTVGLVSSGVQLCRDGGGPLRVFVDEIEPRRSGERELFGGETIGPCGVDLSGDVPRCPDRDRDGTCDADDACPDVYNPVDTCPDGGFCRQVKVDPLCAFRCESLTFELREEDGTTLLPDGVRTVSVAGGGTGLDIAVEVCRAFGDPPPGFSVERVVSGCQLCRSDGRPFRIFLRHLEEGAERVQEVTTGVKTAACGLRIWGQPRRCEDEGDVDADGDGVCDRVDNCPLVANSSQADQDGDCAGDACQSGSEPFVPADLCNTMPPVALVPDREETLELTLDACHRAACFAFDAPVGKPVTLTLTGGDPASVHSLRVRAGGEVGLGPEDDRVSGLGGRALRLAVPSAAEVRYFVRVDVEGVGERTSELVLTLRSVDLSLASVSPSSGAQGGRAGLVILGGGFEKPPAGTGTVFRLVPAAGGPAITASEEDTAVLSPGRAEVVFDLRQAPPVAPGTSLFYHLEAIEGPITARLDEAFEVVDPESAFGLDVRLTGQSFYRRRVLSRATLRIQNRAAGEITAPFFRVSVPSHVNVRLLREPELRSEVLVLGAAAGGFAGRLPPGGVVEVPILLESDCASLLCPSTFSVDLLTPLPGDFVAWGSFDVPPGMSAADWQAAQNALPGVLGYTWDDVHASLAAIATRLTRRGVDGTSVREQFRFAVRQALGLPSAAVAGRLIDAATRLPIGGATIVAIDGGGNVVSHTRTDARGAFALDWLENGARYRFEAAGHQGGREEDTPPDGDLLDLELRVTAGDNPRRPACAGCAEERLPRAAPRLFPPPKVFTRIAGSQATFVGPVDPNEKTGPEGEGEQRFIGSDAEALYTIYFENKPSATAPAQRVSITDRLDPRLDWSSVRLLDVSVAGRIYPLRYLSDDRQVGYRLPVSLGEPIVSGVSIRGSGGPEPDECADVDFLVSARVHPGEGLITWLFESVDCGTGGTIERSSLRGFLPANREHPEGEGFVSFAVSLEPDLPDDSPIFNRAEIRFDDEAAIVTNSVRNVYSLFLPAEEPGNPIPATFDPDTGDCALPTSDLSWAPAEHATSYDVYFWRPGEEEPFVERELLVPSVRLPFDLEHDAIYRWRVIARNIRQVETPGPEWIFCTTPPPPDCPPPPGGLRAENGDCELDAPLVLHWDAVVRVQAYAIRWGRGGVWKEAVLDETETQFTVPDHVAPGTYEWQVLALNEGCPVPDWDRAVETGTFRICAPDVAFVRGDANSDDDINLTDGVRILTYLFIDATRGIPCKDAADADDNGVLQLTDAVAIFQWLFVDPARPPGPPTPSRGAYPAGDCGVDPTEDSLGCAVNAGKCS